MNSPILNGRPVSRIHANLTAGVVDLTQAKPLTQNIGIAFQGTTKGGAFEVDGDTARAWLALPRNPNGRPNSDVVKPWINGGDIVRRPVDHWIIDFGVELSERDAALYEMPFEHVSRAVRPERAKQRRDAYRNFWWRHVEPRPGLRRALTGLPRYICTPRVSKHRVFVWIPAAVLPDSRLVVVARNDDIAFGILHSRFHELWSLCLGSRHGVGNDPQYTPKSGFETFPFPDEMTPDRPVSAYARTPAAETIAFAARHLDALREAWLNPPDLVERVSEVVPGFPDRLLPRNAEAAVTLKKRTLTNLYNERPAWLANAHRDLDEAVAAAYGWPADLSDDEVLARLLDLNLARTGGEATSEPVEVELEQV